VGYGRIPQTSSKPEKDLRQAATLIEALVERYPGAIEDAAAACDVLHAIVLMAQAH